MFCTECNRQIPDDAFFCCYCGIKIELKDKPSKQANTQEQPEKILIQGRCRLILSKYWYSFGKAVLTDRRFIYLKYNLINLLLQPDLLKLESDQLDIEIPNSEIGWVEESEQGLLDTFIVYAKGGIKYEFYASNRWEWKEAIAGVILNEYIKKSENETQS